MDLCTVAHAKYKKSEAMLTIQLTPPMNLSLPAFLFFNPEHHKAYIAWAKLNTLKYLKLEQRTL